MKSSDKSKIANLDRSLKMALIACMAVAVLISSLVVYEFSEIHYRKVTLPVEKHQALVKSVEYLLFVVMPLLAGGYFLMGFVMWNYLRKKRKLESAN